MTLAPVGNERDLAPPSGTSHTAGVGPEMRYTRNGDISLAYWVMGEGAFDLVVIPGFISHFELAMEDPLVARFVNRLASFCRLVFFDKRGTGLSDRGVAPVTLEDYVGDVAAVMDAAGSERAALMGISEGGPTAIAFAATYPARASALVLYGSYARVLEDTDYPVGLPRELVAQGAEHIVERWGTGVGLNAFAPSIGDDPRAREWWARMQRMAAGPGDVRAIMNSYYLIDVRYALPTVSIPTLILHRKGDRLVPVELGRHLADKILDAKYVELDGSDHFFWTENAGAILEEIEEFLTGVRHGPEPTRKLATTMFGDIVGSTELAARVGDSAWRELLQRQDAMVRRTLDRFSGREVKTLGDGFLATFEGSTSAIRCAGAIRDGATGLGLGVKLGIHTGEIELIGDDIAGIAVHIAHRVADLAGPGEIWVSATVPGVVAGSGVEFLDRGAHGLKGVPDEWRLFSVERL